MNPDWRHLCQGEGLRVVGDGVDVSFHDRRHQRVRVVETNGALLIHSVVTGAAATRQVQDPALLAWRRNCLSRVVGLRVDERGRLIGQAWVPLAGLEAHEFQLCVRTVATECDRVEQLLTGRDVE